MRWARSGATSWSENPSLVPCWYTDIHARLHCISAVHHGEHSAHDGPHVPATDESIHLWKKQHGGRPVIAYLSRFVPYIDESLSHPGGML